MAEPWFQPQGFGVYVGAIGGGVGLVCTLGSVTGILAPRGKGRGVLTIVWAVCAAAGLGSLAMGVVALVSRQPHGVWYPLLLDGVLVGGLSTMAVVMLPRLYQAAEQRKLAAGDLRSGGAAMG
jgi:hypothetical protein